MNFDSLLNRIGLARASKDQRETERIRTVLVDLQRQADTLTRRDLGEWRRAWQAAINPERPDRRRLYDIYRDVDADLHLTGCVTQRSGFVKARSFRLTDKDGNDREELRYLFDSIWFKTLVEYVLQATYWGHSLIELGPIVTDMQGRPIYSGVTLLPRKHVIPEKGRIVLRQGDNWQSGIDYRNTPYNGWLIEAGGCDNLGLYLKAASQTIPKKNAVAAWDNFAEIFGMPLRVARTTTRDPKEREDLEDMMKRMGEASYAITGQDTDIQLIENSRGDAYNVYDRRIERANSELSKLILTQTMTIDDGSSLSQSQTHLKAFQNTIEADADNLRDIINDQLLPRMKAHGFAVDGITFDWDYSIDYTPSEQMAFEQMILNNYEVNPEYFEQKYNIPVGERRQPFTMSRGEERPFFD